MEEKKKNRREWVKNVSIVFLVILLILTFFSNTIMNQSLVQVSAQYMDSGAITNKVRGNGIIESADPYQVKVKFQRVVDSIEVKAGDYVEEGQTICYLAGEDSSELKAARIELERAKQKLKSAENKYMMSLVTSGLDTSVISDGGKVKSTQEYITQIDAANNAIQIATVELEAQKKIVAVFEKKEEEIRRQIDSTPSSTVDVTEEVKALNNAKTAYENAMINVSQKNNEIDEIEIEIQRVIDNTPSGTEPDVAELKEKKKNAENERNNAITQKNNAEYAMNNAQNVLDNKKASGDTSALINKLKKELSSVSDELAKGKEVLEEKEGNYENSKKQLEKIMADITAVFGLADLQLAVDNAQIEVDVIQERIEKLTMSSELKSIDAPVDGTIVSLYITSGSEIPVDGVVAIMQPKGKGYKVEMSIENEKADYLAVGDKAEVINSWLYSNLDIRISGILPDKENPEKKKLVCFDVSGENIGVGERVGISVGQKSDNFEMIVPNSAIHEDNQGTFIFVVTTKPTPLGIRYYAQRVNVDVLASDDLRTAINGQLFGSEFVITASNKPIVDNQQIRLSE